jgi:nicotinamidase/pyrazinamidase
MHYVEAPADYEGPLPSIFLAGGISGCELWQPCVAEMLEGLAVAVVNPRRDDYPWHDPAAAEEQIRWEFEQLSRATACLFWFPPQTLCPIALYELGRWSAGSRPMFVGVHPDYQRRVDVEIQLGLARPEVSIVHTLEELAAQVIERFGNVEFGIRNSELSSVGAEQLRTPNSEFRIPHSALLLIDIQNDFLPGGALAVPDGHEVIPLANRLAQHFDLVIATQDWHPPGHGSFAASHPGKRPGDTVELDGLTQVLWPTHCVQGSRGAELASSLDTGKVTRVFRKGTDPSLDSYSGLFDNAHRKSTGLDAFLREQGVTDLYVAGLATDYCVKHTAQDAKKLGFNVFVVADACRGVNLQPRDSERALAELKQQGVHIVNSKDVLARRPSAV